MFPEHQNDSEYTNLMQLPCWFPDVSLTSLLKLYRWNLKQTLWVNTKYRHTSKFSAHPGGWEKSPETALHCGNWLSPGKTGFPRPFLVFLSKGPPGFCPIFTLFVPLPCLHWCSSHSLEDSSSHRSVSLHHTPQASFLFRALKLKQHECLLLF